MDHRVLLAFFVPVVLSSPGCSSSSSGGGGGGTPAPNPSSPALLGEDCDPIDPFECGFPYPSNVWREADKTTPTGYHQFYGPTTLPQWAPGKHIDPTPWASKDGFSPGAAMMTFWPDVSVTGLPDPNSIQTSIVKTSPTIVMEYDTGALVPHWDELDDLATTPDGARAFFIRPAYRLKDATRYIVAIRHVKDSEGNVIAAAPAFQALRDNSPSNDVSVGLRRSLYSDIIGKLQAEGITTSDLQMAWDFTTASQTSTTSDMVSMRDQALAVVGNDGPAYTITQVTDNPNPYIRRRITGNMTVPLYLTNPAICSQGSPPPGPGCPGSSINRDKTTGKPVQNGTASYPFLVQIPNSIVNLGTTGAIIQNAHGLLGDLTEGQDSYMAEICDREHYVEIAVDLEGFASDDANYVTNVIAGDLGQFQHVVDRIHQGYINELLAMRMMMGKMATDPQTQFNGMPTIDTTKRYYRGDSQGGIGGGVYMAISTDVTRGLLDNTGAPYDLLLARSVDFSPFFLVLKGIYTDPAQLQLGINLIQQLWDNAEPDGYISYITDNLLPNTPSHNVLIHDGLGDQQVSPLGAQFEARTLGAKNLQAVNREIYGITDAPGGFTGNGYCEYNFWLPTSQWGLTQAPPSAAYPDPHDALRQLNSAQDMADQFFRTGVVNQTCENGGPCAAPGSSGDPSWSTTSLLTPASQIEAGTAPADGGVGDAATE
jgi:hypothetical protein